MEGPSSDKLQQNITLNSEQIRLTIKLVDAVKIDNFNLCSFIANKDNINETDNDGVTPLIWSIKNNNFEIFKLLIEHNADINILDNLSNSPLIWAVNKNNFKICEELVKNGGDVNIVTNYGSTPLILAANNTYFDDICLLLIEYKADFSKLDKKQLEEIFELLD